MKLQPRTVGGVSILDLEGRFDAYVTAPVSAWLSGITATQQPSILVNLGGVTFVDSAALAALVQGLKQARQTGGDLRLCSLQQPVRIIFELTRLDQAFRIYPDEPAAVGSFAA